MKKTFQVVFYKFEIFKKNVILGPIFMVCVFDTLQSCFISDPFLFYKSVNRHC